MQIVIDIPEESFKAIKNEHFAIHDDINDLFYWIANGTPLPKGHGRLIDADDLEHITVCSKTRNSGITRIAAPTIIGAESEVE